MADRAILVVSFGTSYNDSRERTIGAIERDIAAAFPDWEVRRAFTSRMIIKKLKQRDGLSIDYVTEGIERMAADGVRKAVIVPTHVVNGEEYDFVKAAAEKYADRFEGVAVSRPVLTKSDDYLEAAGMVRDKLLPYARSRVGDDAAGLVLMGHGTAHPANSAYSQLQLALMLEGVPVYVTTVEGWPAYADTLKMMGGKAPKKLAVMPFMVVAGDHANNDMAGDEDGSLVNVLGAAGYDATPVIMGLGECQAFRRMFVERAADAVSTL